MHKFVCPFNEISSNDLKKRGHFASLSAPYGLNFSSPIKFDVHPTVRHCHRQFGWPQPCPCPYPRSHSHPYPCPLPCTRRIGKDELWGWVQVAPATPITPVKVKLRGTAEPEFAAGAGVVVSAAGVAEMPYSWPWPWPWPWPVHSVFRIPYFVFCISGPTHSARTKVSGKFGNAVTWCRWRYVGWVRISMQAH